MRTPCWILGLLVAGSLTVPALASAVTAPARPAATKSGHQAPVLPWIEDDYTRAMAQAKSRQLPIFVESWAPW